MITGAHELSLEELEEKFGFMASSTKCCASGTCTPNSPEMLGPTFRVISQVFDQRDPQTFVQTLGQLKAA